MRYWTVIAANGKYLGEISGETEADALRRFESHERSLGKYPSSHVTVTLVREDARCPYCLQTHAPGQAGCSQDDAVAATRVERMMAGQSPYPTRREIEEDMTSDSELGGSYGPVRR